MSDDLSPAERYAAARDRQTTTAATPRLEEFRERIEFPLDDVPARRLPRRSRPATACWSPRPTGAGKTIVAEFAVHLAIAAAAREGVLHDADEGAQQPEVLRARRRARRGQRRPAHRRQQHQQRRARRRDDHRGAAQHALRRLAAAARPGVRRDGRGALPRRPVPRRGLGGGHHPPPADGAPGLAQRHGVERRGVRRLAAGRARRHRRDRLGGAPRPARAARAGAQQAARAVRLVAGMAATNRVNPELARLAASGGRAAGTFRGAASRPPPPQGPAADRVRRQPPGTAADARQSDRMDRPEVVRLLESKNLLPAIFFVFSRVGLRRAPCSRCVRSGISLTERWERDEIRVDRRGAHAADPRRRPRRARLLGLARRPPARRRRAPRRHAARRSRRSSRSCSSASC